MSAVIVAFSLVGCEKPYIDAEEITEFQTDSVKNGADQSSGGSSNGDDKQDLFLFENDTASFYVARTEMKAMLLSEFRTHYTQVIKLIKPYRLPTKQEAALLRHISLPKGWWSGTRCFCVNGNGENDKVYTFAWGSGSVSVAGNQTKYVVKPILTVLDVSKQAGLTINIDGKWKNNHIERF